MYQSLKNVIVTGITIGSSSPREEQTSLIDEHLYSLCFCTEGQASHMYTGNPDIFGKNHAVIFPQGEIFSLFDDKEEYSLIHFKCLGSICDAPIIIPIENPGPYLRDYEQMRILNRSEENHLKVFGIFYHMLHNLLTMSMTGILLPALKYIEENYKNPELTIAEIAKQCHISEVYFRKLFVTQYHIPPKQFLINIRMNRAKQLLAEGKLKTSAIAAECGFTSAYHFCRAFKNQIGVTPTEYLLHNRIPKI